MANVVDQSKEQMKKSVESTKENFAGIRKGRANPALLNGIVNTMALPPPSSMWPPLVSQSLAHFPSHHLTPRRLMQWRRPCATQIWGQAHVATDPPFC